ncbi:MAG: hypothetical protein N3C57_02030 [Aquificaceae bacterium]|nr:hypothetical protein [Aquificaceae bacterium]
MQVAKDGISKSRKHTKKLVAYYGQKLPVKRPSKPHNRCLRV